VTTFVFVLKPGATSAQVFRMLTELEDEFPQHDFIAGDGRFREPDQAILATIDSASEKSVDPNDVGEVSALFQMKLREIEGWKPS
jgi:hypothetical protein